MGTTWTSRKQTSPSPSGGIGVAATATRPAVKNGASAPQKLVPSQSINPATVATWPGAGAPVKANPSAGPTVNNLVPSKTKAPPKMRTY